MAKGIFLSRPGCFSRSTTNSTSTVDRAGRKPHCSPGRIPHCSQQLLKAERDDFQQYIIPCLHGQRVNFLVIAAIKTILLFEQDLDGIIFPLLEAITRFSNIIKDVVKGTSEFGVDELQRFGRQRESGPAAFQLLMLQITDVISSIVGSSLSDSASGR